MPKTDEVISVTITWIIDLSRCSFDLLNGDVLIHIRLHNDISVSLLEDTVVSHLYRLGTSFVRIPIVTIHIICFVLLVECHAPSK